jgi:two-component system sensor histidine kinase EvgS
MRKATVLIIDEHPDVCVRLARGLRSTAGLQVIGHTSSAVVGAELAHLRRPDVILADFKRGGRSRPELYRWLKGMSPRSMIVALSSYFLVGEVQQCLDAGVSKCLLKGISMQQLADELRKVAVAGGLKLREKGGDE